MMYDDRMSHLFDVFSFVETPRVEPEHDWPWLGMVGHGCWGFMDLRQPTSPTSGGPLSPSSSPGRRHYPNARAEKNSNPIAAPEKRTRAESRRKPKRPGEGKIMEDHGRSRSWQRLMECFVRSKSHSMYVKPFPQVGVCVCVCVFWIWSCWGRF